MRELHSLHCCRHKKCYCITYVVRGVCWTVHPLYVGLLLVPTHAACLSFAAVQIALPCQSLWCRTLDFNPELHTRVVGAQPASIAFRPSTLIVTFSSQLLIAVIGSVHTQAALCGYSGTMFLQPQVSISIWRDHIGRWPRNMSNSLLHGQAPCHSL